jgi:hypothetical protein
MKATLDASIFMSDLDDNDYKLAQQELRDAVLNLRKITGQPMPDFVPGEPPYCSFCGKGVNQVRKLVAGPDVYICNECVAKAQELIDGS